MARGRRKVALITGAGRGIGFATARAFVTAGYAVVIAERAEARGRRAARRLRDAGAEAVFVKADVAEAGAAERAVRAAMRRFHRLDCVVNNAGVIHVGRLDRLSRAAIQEIVSVNLLGPLLVARAALPTCVVAVAAPSLTSPHYLARKAPPSTSRTAPRSSASSE